MQFPSTECIFVGYSPSHKGYKCLDQNGKLFISKDVLFNEFRFPFTYTSTATKPPSTLSPLLPLQIYPTVPLTNIPAASTPLDSTPTPSTVSPNINPPQPFTIPAADSPVNTHPMQTRSKSGIVKPHLNPTLLLTVAEHGSVKQALSSPHWKSAIQQEFDALIANQTWTLVQLPPGCSVVGCKWVFRIKENPDGSINKYKTHLVAKGFNQQFGCDYSETFAPVVKPVTIRIILTLALT